MIFRRITANESPLEAWDEAQAIAPHPVLVVALKGEYMRIPHRLLCSSLAFSSAIASVVLSAQAQTLTPKIIGEPSRNQPGVSSPQQPGVVQSCEEQIKSRFGDDRNGSRANYDLGWCYLSSKKFDDAVAAFQKSFESRQMSRSPMARL
jgi:hypothetical protein